MISGPGATLWGANAVNGVINVITRAARDTQGALRRRPRGQPARPTRVGRYGGAARRGRALPRVRDGYRPQTQRASPTARPSTTTRARSRLGFRADWGTRDAGIHRAGRRLPRRSRTGRARGPGDLGRQPPRPLERRGRGRLQLARAGLLRAHETRRVPSPSATSSTSPTWSSSMRPPCPRATGSSGAAAIGRRGTRPRPSLLVAFFPAERDLRWDSLFVQDEIQLAPGVRAHPWRRRSSTTSIPARNSCRTCASRGSPRIASSRGRRCRARCAHPRASTASSSCPAVRRSSSSAGRISSPKSPTCSRSDTARIPPGRSPIRRPCSITTTTSCAAANRRRPRCRTRSRATSRVSRRGAPTR